ncbi:hypothetical protein H2O64_12885 [Kordia sp. YSTF-M3]|uniref:Bacteriocin n=1 Tax=Kordia aestuariivivens TaxID=2759037 RepID=A0ABR7QAG7_9FLAO|nr:hypothetical protein [Kordia aestuariivivens]MBC8755565.1 hypothetical protein [Kordia aestuariivivens]
MKKASIKLSLNKKKISNLEVTTITGGVLTNVGNNVTCFKCKYTKPGMGSCYYQCNPTLPSE